MERKEKYNSLVFLPKGSVVDFGVVHFGGEPLIFAALQVHLTLPVAAFRLELTDFRLVRLDAALKSAGRLLFGGELLLQKGDAGLVRVRLVQQLPLLRRVLGPLDLEAAQLSLKSAHLLIQLGHLQLQLSALKTGRVQQLLLEEIVPLLVDRFLFVRYQIE